MAGFDELERQYEKIPNELKTMRRWVCYVNRLDENGNKTKLPVSPKTPKTNGELDSGSENWTDFDTALRYCAENNLDGLGFELEGSGMFGVDLDNHPDANGESMPVYEFQQMANDFVKTLSSYSEWSESKNGIHIICFGKLPEGKRFTSNIKLYDGTRFFAMTGQSIGRLGVHERTMEVRTLWDKYVKQADERITTAKQERLNFDSHSDEEVIANARSAKRTREKFDSLMQGDWRGLYQTKEQAIQALCNFLGYYSECDEAQMDRLFRNSGLYEHDHWERKGKSFIQSAVETCSAILIEKKNEKKAEAEQQAKPTEKKAEMNLDDEDEPIFHINEEALRIRKMYSADDTGNAKRFYDYFGQHFHYNSDDKTFMFWTGKKWITDIKGVIRKYANQIIYLMKDEMKEVEALSQDDDEETAKKYKGILAAYKSNIGRVSNKNGKDAMLSELQTIGKMAVKNSELDEDKYLLNTDSGIVDLRNGEILPWDRERLMSLSTNVKVSYETPKTWLFFLHGIFERSNPEETEQIIECLQRCIGYSLTGLTIEQVMFILFGDGSNGKSTMLAVLRDIMGDYYQSIDSSQLMVQNGGGSNVALQYSLAELVGSRLVVTQETEKGDRLAAATVKKITGEDLINAQRKYGRPFSYLPKFKVWYMTNPLPNIRSRDYGTWRRIFLFAFKRQFKDSEKDKEMPEKLRREYPQILGWAIQGAVKYLREKDLKQPQCLKDEVVAYQAENDGIAEFLSSECHDDESGVTGKNELYNAYKLWAMNNREYAMPESSFRAEIIRHGYKIFANAVSGSQYYEGLVVNGESQVSRSTLLSPFDD